MFHDIKECMRQVAAQVVGVIEAVMATAMQQLSQKPTRQTPPTDRQRHPCCLLEAAAVVDTSTRWPQLVQLCLFRHLG